MDKKNITTIATIGKIGVGLIAKSIIDTTPVLNTLANAAANLFEIQKIFKQEQFNYFVEQLNKKNHEITLSDINKNSIAQSTYMTFNAMLRVREKEKINILVDLYDAYLLTKDKSNENKDDFKYDLFLSILDNLTFIEYSLLSILYKWQNSTERKSQQFADKIHYDNDLQYANTFWNEFIKNVNEQFGLEKSYVEALLVRIGMTGCYIPIVGHYLGYEGGKGLVSPLFVDFMQFINNEHK